MLGTSTPSLRQRALLSSPRWSCGRLRNRTNSRSRWPLVIAPETCSLQIAPVGRVWAGIQRITLGISALNSRAAFSLPWKEMIRRSSYFRMLFARPI
jgi:hypothetical protein